MTPCRSDCPAGDCAGCAFPPMTRCVPSMPCAQQAQCARAAVPEGTWAIDASVTAYRLRFAAGRDTGAPFCAMFVDQAGAALRRVA